MSQSRTNPLHLDPNAATLCATLRAFTLLPTHTMMYCYGSLLCCGAVRRWPYGSNNGCGHYQVTIARCQGASYSTSCPSTVCVSS